MNSFNKIVDFLFNKMLTPLLNILCIAILLTTCLSVICRYVFHYAIVWSPEISRFLYIFIIFIGTSLGIRSNLHIGLDIEITRLSTKSKEIIEIIKKIILMIFFIILVYLGFQFVGYGMLQMTQTLGIAKGWIYLIIPISSFFMFIAVFQKTYFLISKIKKRSMNR